MPCPGCERLEKLVYETWAEQQKKIRQLEKQIEDMKKEKEKEKDKDKKSHRAE